MKTTTTDSKNLWTKAPVANLVRYEPSGIYFARAKVRGKAVRKSLETNVLSVAKLRLADVLESENKALGAHDTKIIGRMTFHEGLAVFQEQQKNSPELKDRTKEYNQWCAEVLLKTWNGLADLDVKRITKHDCLCWRAEFGKRYSATVVNGALSILRRVFDIAMEMGARYDNPARSREMRRARVRRKELRLPEPDQFGALIQAVREAGSRHSANCADGIEFFSYAGPRLREAARIFGRDCSFLKNEIVIRGHPKTGTKNWEMWRVPMIPEMRKLLERLKAERGEQEFLDHPVLKVRKFSNSLKRACQKLGLFHLTHHDLRHLFATRCIESGVDVPTVAKWLGHKDGGVLAMRTYGHLRDKHSADMARKVIFLEASSAAAGAAPPDGATCPGAAPEDSLVTAAKAKAKYSYPWWAAEDPAVVFWGQINEAAPIVPREKYLAAAAHAMGREVLPSELEDPKAMVAEFQERVPPTTIKALSAKISMKRDSEQSKAD
jgi:integrase